MLSVSGWGAKAIDKCRANLHRQESAPYERMAAAMLASVVNEKGVAAGAPEVKSMVLTGEPAIHEVRHCAGTVGAALKCASADPAVC